MGDVVCLSARHEVREPRNADPAHAVEVPDGNRVLGIDSTGELLAYGRQLQHRALAAIEADLALVVSRGRIAVDRFVGANEDAIRDGAQDVFLAMSEALLQCSLLRHKLVELISQCKEAL